MQNVLAALADVTLVAVRISGSDWPRSALREAPIPDAWMGLVETRDGRRRYAPAGADPRPDRDGSLLLVRNRAVVVPLAQRGAVSASGDLFDARGEALVRWMPRIEPLAALASALDGEQKLSLAALALRVARDGGDQALLDHIRSAGATDLLEHDQRDALTMRLREGLRRLSFEMGLTVERVMSVSFSSESHARGVARKREVEEETSRIEARRHIEAASLIATRERLDGLGDIFNKLKDVAQASGGRWGQLLPALAPAERVRLLQNLWRVAEQRRVTSAILAITSDSLLWIDPHDLQHPSKRVSPPADLGPLRSVIGSGEQLLVGAASGVWALRAEDGGVISKLAVTTPTKPRTGFNSVAVGGDGRIYATSSSLGLWAWAIASGEGECILAAEGAPRAIRALTVGGDGRLLFAVDDCVHTYVPGAAAPLTAMGSSEDIIHGLGLAGRRVYAGIADGRLMRADLDQPSSWTTVQRFASAVESVQTRHWDDLVEVVIAAGDQGVLGVFDEQAAVVPLLRAGSSIRRAWAGDDLIVGLSAARDRLWVQLDDGGAPQEAPIARLAGRSIQDVALVIESTPRAGKSAPA